MPALVAARYRLGEPVGRGGMGRVWRAHDQVLDRVVAVKEIVPPPGLSDPEGVHRRTLREARATARLSHPGVIRVFDVLEVDGGTWIVMEYVPSRSLQEVIAADGPLPPRRVAKIGLDLLDALVAANRAGVEHRDVKPANVLIADDGRVMLTDFGIAAIADDPSNSTSDALIGSPEYMPPERTKSEHLGLPSDLWSLGATLYAAVEGQSPFHRATVAATLTAITISPPDPPKQAGPLAPLLEGLLRKDPADRPSAKDAARMLRSAASGAYGRASIPAPDVRDGTAPAQAAAVLDPSTPGGPREDPGPAPAGEKSEEAVLAAGPSVASGEVAGAVPASGLPVVDGESAGAVPAAGLPVVDGELAGAVLPAADEGPAPAVLSAAPPEAPPVADGPSAGTAFPLAEGESARAALPLADEEPAPAVLPAAGGEAAGGEKAPAALSEGRRRWTAMAVIVLSILLVAGAAFWFFNGQAADRPARPEASPAPTVSPSAATSSSSSPSGPSSSSPSSPPSSTGSSAGSTPARPVLPSGWHDYHDKTGFEVYVPNGWSRSQKGTMVYFRGDGRVLGIDQSDHPKSDPLADWRKKSAYRVSNGDFPGYHLIRLAAVNYLKSSADWEYTFNGSGARQHVDNRNILASSHQAYAIYWQTSDSEWSAHKDDLALIYASFRPK
jgi:hypothetical protein